MQDGETVEGQDGAARAACEAAKRARLFEMLRQGELAARALKRLHLKQQRQTPLPSPSALAASLADHSSVRPS